MMCICFALATAQAAEASGEKSGFGLGFKKMQDLWRGVTEPTKITTCRLARKKVYKGEQICVYSGANRTCLLYTSPSPRDLSTSRMPSSA